MNVSGLLNIMRRESEKVVAQQADTRMAIVDSYDPVRYCAKVWIQPENVLTGFLPIATEWVGNGWGMFCPPTKGDVVDVHFQEWGKNAGYISKRFFSDPTPPLPVNSGEFWLVHQSGSCLKFTNDGKVLVQSATDMNLQVGNDLNINVLGGVSLTSVDDINMTAPNLNVTGNITATGDITDQSLTTNESMRDQRQIYDSHTHPGVQSGGSNTGAPNQPE